MANPPTFGVTVATLSSEMFPALPGGYSGSSAPNTAAVQQHIYDVASEVCGWLNIVSVNFNAINTDGGNTMPISFNLLHKLVSLGAGYLAGRSMTGTSAAVAEKWELEYHGDPKGDKPDEFPGGLLGQIIRNPSMLADSNIPSPPPQAIQTMVDHLNLQRPNSTQFEPSVIPNFRYDDQL